MQATQEMGFSAIFRYFKRRYHVVAVAVISIFALFVLFIYSENNVNLQSITTDLLTYSGLLLIFYIYVMEAHYKELHQIATDPALLNPKPSIDIEYYKKNKEHNEVMVLLSFFGIFVLFISGIFDIINLEVKRNFLLDFSVFSIFLTSIGMLIILWYILNGKIKDAEDAIKGAKNAINPYKKQ